MNAKRIVLIIGLCMLIFQGTAYGIIGVDDNVPAQEVIFPFVCEGHVGADGTPVFGTLNTLWAFAETKGQNTNVFHVVRNRQGTIMIDYPMLLTPNDVGEGECRGLIMGMPPDRLPMLTMTIGGKSYFAGYLTLSNVTNSEDNLIGWTYFADSYLFYASANFKPYQAEGGADQATFAEDMGAGPILADQYYLRYFVMNNLSETFNWWIVLRGSSLCPPGVPFCSSVTVLECVICNDQEDCVSANVPVPDRLNIINVDSILPAGLYPWGYPRDGFAYCALVENGINQGISFTNRDFTAFTWSYERQQIISQSPCTNHVITDNALWSVIDPADRLRR